VAEQEFFALENKNTFTINGLDKLSKGIYYIQLTDSENTVAYKKIVKQ
jgi:hypothetical protein